MKNIAKPVLYTLVGGSLVYGFLFAGHQLASLVAPTEQLVDNFIIDGLLGVFIMIVCFLVLWGFYELGRFILEKLS